MTREEAIKELKIIREDYWDEYEDPMPALDMAIKALELCEDAISRQDALDALHMCLSTNSYDDDVTGDSYICYEEAEYEIEKLQSVQPKPKTGHWIYKNYNWRCSKCNEPPKTMGYVGTADFMAKHFKFCNHCGAKMIDVPDINDGKFSEIPKGSDSQEGE